MADVLKYYKALVMFNKEYFEKVFQKADPWEYGRSGYERAKHRRQLEAIKLACPRPGQVLEIGCAEGAFTALLADSFPRAEVVGIDLSRAAVVRAKERCSCFSSIQLREGDIVELLEGQELPARFDIVIQSESLYYMFPHLLLHGKLAGYLRKVTGTLKVGGVLVTSNGIDGITRGVMGVYYQALKRLCRLEYSAEYREWNELRGKYSTYDLKVFRKK